MKNNMYIFVYLIACIVIVGYTYGFPPITGIDDANIYFVYMKNLSEGHGFVYNIGGERVEGFTSILWTLIGSLIFKLTNHVEIVLFVINIILILLTLIVAGNIIKLFFSEDKNKSAYLILFYGMLLIFPGFYEWTIFSLLETALWTFEITLFSYLLVIPHLQKEFTFVKSSVYMTLLLPFFMITRPESMLIGVVIIVIRFLQILFDKETKLKRAIIVNIGPLASSYLLSAFLLIQWRLYYFGYPFPNTYYVKMSDGFYNNLVEGYYYIYGYLFQMNPTLFVLYIVLFVWGLSVLFKKNYSERYKVISVFCILSIVELGIPLYTGGDHFPQYRFCQPCCIIFYTSVIMGVSTLNGYYDRLIKIRLNPVLVSIVILAILSTLPTANRFFLLKNKDSFTILHELNGGKSNRQLGIKLNEFFTGSEPSIAVICAGFAYTYDGNVFDVLGLNNSQVAHDFSERPKVPHEIFKSHRAFSKKIFLKQQPDLFSIDFVSDTSTYIPFFKQADVDSQFGTKVTKFIYKDLDFNKMYKSVYITNKSDNNTIFCYGSNKYLSKIDTLRYDVKYIH